MGKNNTSLLKPKNLRYSIIMGTILFLFFGLFDYFTLGELFPEIFFMRFWILLVSVPLTFLSYIPKMQRHMQTGMYVLFLYTVSLYGVILHRSADFGEVFYLYQFGYIILVLWIGFVFRTKLWHLVSLSAIILIIINVCCRLNNTLDIPNAWVFGINLLIISAFSLIIFGVYFLKRFENSIRRKNQKLKREKLQLQKAKNRAEEADKLKTAFLANLSHEIRTPLNAVAGFSALMAEEELGKEEQKLYSKCIVDNSEDLVELIEDIINFSVIESNGLKVRKSNVCVNDIFASINQITQGVLMRYAEKKELLISKQWHENNMVFIDIDRVAQIFKVLISNALKFTEVGHIVYGIKDVNDEKIHFFVKDTGMGIPEDKYHLIFDRFTQANKEIQSRYGGAGIGLAVAKQMVENMGGEIWVESKIGKGSVFYFTVEKNEAVKNSLVVNPS